MKDKDDDQFTTILGSAAFLLIGVLTAVSITSAYQDGYKAGIKDSPTNVTVQGDQIITTTKSDWFSGGNQVRTETGNKEEK